MTMPTDHSSAGDDHDSDPGARRAVDVLVLGADGTLHQECWTTAADGGLLKQLQAAIGGLADAVALTDDLELWVHDEGLYVCEPNPVATLLALALGRNTFLYGTAVITGGANADGSTRGLSPRDRARLVTATHQAAASPTRLLAVSIDAVHYASRYR